MPSYGALILCWAMGSTGACLGWAGGAGCWVGGCMRWHCSAGVQGRASTRGTPSRPDPIAHHPPPPHPAPSQRAAPAAPLAARAHQLPPRQVPYLPEHPAGFGLARAACGQGLCRGGHWADAPLPRAPRLTPPPPPTHTHTLPRSCHHLTLSRLLTASQRTHTHCKRPFCSARPSSTCAVGQRRRQRLMAHSHATAPFSGPPSRCLSPALPPALLHSVASRRNARCFSDMCEGDRVCATRHRCTAHQTNAAAVPVRMG